MSTLRVLFIAVGLVAFVYGLVGMVTAWPPAVGKVEKVKIPAAVNVERALLAMDLPYTVEPSSNDASKESSVKYVAVKVERQDEFLYILSEAKGFAETKIEKTLYRYYTFNAETQAAAAYVYRASIPQIRVSFVYGERVEFPPTSLRFGMIYVGTPAASDTEFSVEYSQKQSWFTGWLLGGIALVLTALILAFTVPIVSRTVSRRGPPGPYPTAAPPQT